MDLLTIADLSYTLLGLTASFVFFGFYLRKEALDFQKDYFDRALDTAKRIEIRFREKSVNMIMSLISNKNSTNIPTEDEIRAKFSELNFAEQINELSKIILESKELMQDFRKVRNFKNKFANMWFLVGVITALNSSLGYIPQQLQPLVLLVDILLVPLGYNMYDYYRTYSKAEQKFVNKVEKEAMTGILNIS